MTLARSSVSHVNRKRESRNILSPRRHAKKAAKPCAALPLKRHVVVASLSYLGDYNLGSGRGAFRKCHILETLDDLPIGPSDDATHVGLAKDQSLV
jgi:hypothetical protein